MTYILTSAKLNATGLRWVNELADFHFDVRYRPGKANADADTLSRMPISFEEYMSGSSEMVSQDVLNAVTSSINESNSTETTWLSYLTATPVMLEEALGSVSTISQVTFQLRCGKILPSLVFYNSCRAEEAPPTRKSSKRQQLYDSFYMNGIDCLFQKMEFSIINLDLGIK